MEFEQQVLSSLSKIETHQAVADERHADILRRLTSLEKAVLGNGKPGIVERVAIVEERTSPARAAVAGGGVSAVVMTVIAAVLRQMGI